ncbi:MAG: RNA polymerase sigma factor [Prevotellaceae bacterium]|nr:RNA polymerase sigma factor [Prevotellaceae bacterium]
MSLIKSTSSFEKMVKEQQESVRRLFLNLTLGDEMLSDDLAQDTFIKAYKSWNTFRMMSSVRTWLFRIAYNTFYDYRRSLKQTSDIDGLPLPQHAEQTTLKMDIYEAMKMLTENERVCVTLAMIDGYSMKEISKIMQQAENTVKSYIHRGKGKLADYLRQQGYE